MKAMLYLCLMLAWGLAAKAQTPPAPSAGHTDMVVSVCFSSDGKYLASGSYDHTIRIWNVADGAQFDTIPVGRISDPRAFCFRPGTHILAYEDSIVIKFRDVGLKQEVAQLDWDYQMKHSGGFGSLQFSADGMQLLAGLHDQAYILWRGIVHGEPKPFEISPWKKGDIEWKEFQTAGDPEGGSIARLSPDGVAIATCGFGAKEVRFWKPGVSRPLRTVSVPDTSISSLAYSASGKRLAIVAGEFVAEIDTATGQIVRKIPVKYGDAIAYSPVAEELAYSDQNSVRILDTRTGKPLRLLSGHTGTVFAIAYSSDGRWIASASRDRTVRLWEARTGTLKATLGTPAKLNPGELVAPKD